MNALTILEARNISKNFGSLQVIDQVDFKIATGSIHAIIGPNGAGKTTLFNLLTGFIPVTAGTVLFKGKDITNLPPYRISEKGIARSFQITSIFPELSVHENVRVARPRHGNGPPSIFSGTSPGLKARPGRRMRFWRLSDSRIRGS